MMDNARFPFAAVLSDIDGTLLDAAHGVSAATSAAVARLAGAGVPFALVTGRMPDGVDTVRAGLGRRVPAVCYSGALVLDGQDRIVASSELRAAEALAVLDMAARDFPGLAPCYFAGRSWLVSDASHPAVVREAGIVEARPEEADLRAVLASGRLPNKLFFSCAGAQALSTPLAEGLRRACPRLTVVRSTNGVMVEVLPGGVDKASGAAALLASLGLGLREALFFGDDANDVPLLRACGRGVAVGNAAPCAREAAGDVALPAPEDGVARYLEGLWG